MIRILLLSAFILSGCAGVPLYEDKTSTIAYSDTHTAPLALKLKSYAQPRIGDSGLAILPNGYEAFTARASLAASATRSIDAQYYLWHDDLVGLSLLALLTEAADRGVRIRLLLDDIDVAGKDFYLAALNGHPKIEIRVFNPFGRKTARSIQYVSQFGNVTRRMHNKSFTADNQATIIGGRNIGNEYFEADPDVAFGDLDAFVIGPVVNEVSNAFDSYWNSGLAHPVEALNEIAVSDADLREVLSFLAQYLEDNQDTEYAKAMLEAPFIEKFQTNALPIEWGQASILVDEPKKLISKRTRTDLQLSTAVSEVIAKSKQELIIFSPYFIPGDAGSKGLIQLAQNGVKVRIVTNSLATNNHRVVHAKYANYRKRLLKAGIELYEVKATRDVTEQISPFGTTKESVLHAKTFVVDRKTTFIGSLNFDPRSFVENTEIGLVFESSKIANEVASWFDQNIAKYTYRLAIDRSSSKRGSIVWMDEGSIIPTVLYHEPETSLWVRVKAKLMSILPIESQL